MFSRVFSGTVVKGAGRGKDLGFPTANLGLTKIDCEDGIYAAKATVQGKMWNALVFVGAAITFSETVRQVEAYLLDFKGDIYGEQVEIVILQKIRDNIKFNSKGALVLRMQEDEQVARRFFADQKNQSQQH